MLPLMPIIFIQLCMLLSATCQTLHVEPIDAVANQPHTFYLSFNARLKYVNFLVSIMIYPHTIFSCKVPAEAKRLHHADVPFERSSNTEIFYHEFRLTFESPQPLPIQISDEAEIFSIHAESFQKLKQFSMFDSVKSFGIVDEPQKAGYYFVLVRGLKHWKVIQKQVRVRKSTLSSCREPVGTRLIVNTKESHYTGVFDEEFMPRMKTKDSITIASNYSQCSKVFSYKFIVERLSDIYWDEACDTTSLRKEIDLAGFNSYRTYIPSDFVIDTEPLSFPPYTLPVGVIRITTVITDIDTSAYKENYMYFRVENTRRDEGFHDRRTPSASSFDWPEGIDLFLDASQSFFDLRSPESGFIDSSLNTDTFNLSCDICSIPDPAVPRRAHISATASLGRKKPLLITITHTCTFVYDSETTKKLIVSNKKTIVVNFKPPGTPRVDIKCVFNCVDSNYGVMPAIVRAECEECKELDSSKVIYKWEPITRRLQIAYERSNYILIFQHIKSSFLVQLTVRVTYSDGTSGQSTLTFQRYADPTRPEIRATISADESVLTSDVVQLQNFAMPLWTAGKLQMGANSFAMYVHQKLPGALKFFSSYSNQVSNFVVKLDTRKRFVGDMALISSNGRKSYLKTVTVKQGGKMTSLSNNLYKRCVQVLSWKTYGLSAHLALAKDIDEKGYSMELRKMPIRLLQHDMLNRSLSYQQSNLAIQALFYIYSGTDGSVGDQIITEAVELLEKIVEASENITTELKTDKLTRIQYQATHNVIRNWMQEEFSLPFQVTGLGKRLLLLIQKIARLYLRTMDFYGRVNTFLYEKDWALTELWCDISKANIPVDLPSVQGSHVYSFKIPYIELKEKMETVNFEQVKRGDYHAVFGLYGTKINFLHRPDETLNLNLGLVRLYMESRREQRAFDLGKMIEPITIEYYRQEADRKYRNITLDVIEDEYGKVVDSTCFIFMVDIWPDYAQRAQLFAPYDYIFSASNLTAKEPSDYLNLPAVRAYKFFRRYPVNFQARNKLFKYLNRRSSHYVMIRAVKSRRRRKPKFGTERKTGKLVHKKVNITVEGQAMRCYYFSQETWYTDRNCRTYAHFNNYAHFQCQCYVHATYSGTMLSDLSMIRDLHPLRVVTFGPTYVVATCVGAMLIAFIAITLRAIKLDKRELYTGDIHVIKDRFSWDAPDQYLVCFITGLWPGAGTRSKVTFSIIGEYGASCLAGLEGEVYNSVYHTTGTELWFLVGSNVKLGESQGLFVHYVSDVDQSQHFWFLDRVIVHNLQDKTTDQYKPQMWFGPTNPQAYLPVFPSKYKRRTDLSKRFFRTLRKIHTFVSPLFVIPGCSYTRIHRGTILVLIVLTTMYAAIIFRGPSKPVFSGDAEPDVRIFFTLRTGVIVSAVTLGAAFFFNILFYYCLGRRLKVHWPVLHYPGRVIRAPETLESTVRRLAAGTVPIPGRPKQSVEDMTKYDTFFEEVIDVREDLFNVPEHQSPSIETRKTVDSREAVLARSMSLVKQSSKIAKKRKSKKLPSRSTILSSEESDDENQNNSFLNPNANSLLDWNRCPQTMHRQKHGTRKLSETQPKMRFSSPTDTTSNLDSLSAWRSSQRHIKRFNQTCDRSRRTESVPLVQPERIQKICKYAKSDFCSRKSYFRFACTHNRKNKYMKYSATRPSLASVSSIPNYIFDPATKDTTLTKSKNRMCFNTAICSNFIVNNLTFFNDLESIECTKENIVNYYSMTQKGINIKRSDLGANDTAEIGVTRGLTAMPNKRYTNSPGGAAYRQTSCKASNSRGIIACLNKSNNAYRVSRTASYLKEHGLEDSVTEEMDEELTHRVEKSVQSHLYPHIVWIAVMLYIVYTSYSVSMSGIVLSLSQTFEWLGIVVIAILLDTIILEPVLFFLYSFSTVFIWRSYPVVKEEILRRQAVIENDLRHRSVLERVNITRRASASPVSQQPMEDSIALFYIHDLLHHIRKKLHQKPPLVFREGTYSLVLFIVTTVVIMNLHSGVYTSHLQSVYIQDLLNFGVSTDTTQSSTVTDFWDYVDDVLIPKLSYLRQTKSRADTSGIAYSSNIRITQTRVVVEKDQCLFTHPKLYNPNCNLALNATNLETRHFQDNWQSPVTPTEEYLQKKNPYFYRHRPFYNSFTTSLIHFPAGGYEILLSSRQKEASQTLAFLRSSDWVDENTRGIIIDFTLYNSDTDFASTVRIAWEFRRAGIFQDFKYYTFPLYFRGISKYVLAIFAVFFVVLTLYSMLKESILLFNNGCISYFTRELTYFELFKHIVSGLVIAGFVYREILFYQLLENFARVSFDKVKQEDFVNFLPLAILIDLINATSGFLAFVLLFQVLTKARSIPRLNVLFKMLVNAFQLLVQPLFLGVAFSCQGYLLFGSKAHLFSTFTLSLLTVIQQMVKPQPIINDIKESSPVLGAFFVFSLFSCMSFVIINFFLCFLNEAYSHVMNRMRLETHGKKTKDIIDLLTSAIHLGRKESDITDEVRANTEDEVDTITSVVYFHSSTSALKRPTSRPLPAEFHTEDKTDDE